MSTQTEAQRLADKLMHQFPLGTAQHHLDGEAAAELLRLEAANAELLEALEDLVCLYPLDSTDGIITSARAAIEKHGGKA